jgi:hypothetical protein
MVSPVSAQRICFIPDAKFDLGNHDDISPNTIHAADDLSQDRGNLPHRFPAYNLEVVPTPIVSTQPINSTPTTSPFAIPSSDPGQGINASPAVRSDRDPEGEGDNDHPRIVPPTRPRRDGTSFAVPELDTTFRTQNRVANYPGQDKKSGNNGRKTLLFDQNNNH